jgi:hypothetical protein
MSKELGIDPEHMGLILSGFSWTYACFRFQRLAGGPHPAALLLSRHPDPVVGGDRVSGAGWHFHRLFLFAFDRRVEAPSYPINNQVVTAGFRPRTRRRHRFLYLGAIHWPGLPAALLLNRKRCMAGGRCFTPPVLAAWLGLVWWLCYRNRGFRANAAEVELISPAAGW